VSTILDLSDIALRKGQPPTIWRDELLPATFRGQQFHCESNSMDGGRHIVTHEFPKRDLPYSEDMGRRPKEFSIRGYFIVYPFNTTQNLYQRDYRRPRNALLSVLDDGQPGVLQLPTLPALYVRCTRYRLTEEEKFGGYCTIDISFVEYGYQPGVTGPDTAALLAAASQTLKARVQAVLLQGPQPTAPTAPPSTL
jgi:prophage DNA circulation protein